MSISSYNGIENGLTPSNSIEWQSSLTAIPPKPYTDILVQHFLKEINFQYYMLYPPTFSQEYASWWSNRADGLKLSPAFTALLLRICGCAAQFISGDTRRKLEVKLGEKVEKLSGRYHKAAQRLSPETPPGKGGLTQVQQSSLAACWFKIEALFTESWHALGSTIHEAQEIRMHKESSNTRLSEFECETKKRAWCVLYIWDWQISASLSRPRIINSSNFKAPKPSWEKSSTEEPPSPVAHVLIQFQLGQRLSKLPGNAADTLAPYQISVFKAAIERWLSELPSSYNLSAPDIKWDAKCPYVVPQRIQLNALGYMILFQQLKSFPIKPEAKNAEEKNLRKVGIECALKLVDGSYLPDFARRLDIEDGYLITAARLA